MSNSLRITAHAVDRWIERVEPGSRAEARLAILTFVRLSRATCKSRWWMRRVPEPGDLFLYCAERRGVCLVVNADGAIVTVYTHAESRRLRADQPRHLQLEPARLTDQRDAHRHLRWRIGGAGSAADFVDEPLVAA